jgi:hypothetical protein
MQKQFMRDVAGLIISQYFWSTFHFQPNIQKKATPFNNYNTLSFKYEQTPYDWSGVFGATKLSYLLMFKGESSKR